MADTRVQLEVEEWIRAEWLPEHLGHPFDRERVSLTSGGEHSFAAVSRDRRTVATISTGKATTAGGKLGVGKLNKLRADMLFLTMVDADRKLVILTEADMHELCLREVEAGRVPQGIDFVHAAVPLQLRERLDAAREASSREVTPRSG